MSPADLDGASTSPDAPTAFPDTTRLSRVLLILLTVVVAWIGVLAYGVFAPSVERFRITLTIETPQGLMSATSMVELIGYDPSPAKCGKRPCDGPRGRLRGVAPLVDLGPHGTLIGMIGDGAVRYFGSIPKGDGPIKSKPLALAWLPANTADPDAAIPVTPKGHWPHTFLEEPIERIIGPDVRYVSTTVERTGAPVTDSIEPPPPWLLAMRNAYAPGKTGRHTWPGKFVLMLGDVEKQFPPKFKRP